MIKRYSNKKMGRTFRVRSRTKGTTDRPRLTVFRSLQFIYAQVIDDSKGVTLVAAKGKSAQTVGEELGKKAKLKKIKALVFDRGPYKYHGQVKTLAEAVRKTGVDF